MSTRDSPEGFAASLDRLADSFSLDEEMHRLAERICDEAKRELSLNGEDCAQKQRLIDSLRVETGDKKGEYLVKADGKYGEELENGTEISSESPWFIPAFVTVQRLIGTCQHGALARALLMARRLRKGQ